MTQTLANLVEQKQKDAEGWALLQKIIKEATLTPEEDKLIHAILNLDSTQRIAKSKVIAEQLGVGECTVRVSS